MSGGLGKSRKLNIVGSAWGVGVANDITEAVSTLQDFSAQSQQDPADPSPIQAGDEANPGESHIPAAEDHVHPVLVDPPVGLGNANAEGTSTALPRADHVHKRDVRVKAVTVDVATRNALDLSDAFVVTDGGAGPDTVIVEVRIEKSHPFLAPAGAQDVTLWVSPGTATVTAVKGYRVGGTGATINARRNGTSEHLAGDLSLTSAATWMDGGAVQNTAYVAGDSLELRLKSIAGGPTAVTIQVELRR